MNRLGLIVIAAWVVSVPVLAQQSANPDPAKPAPKTEAKDAPVLPGRWSMAISTEQGSRQATMDLKVDAKDARKVTGTIASDMGEAPLAGEFADGKLSFSMTMQSSGGEMQLYFSGAFKDDGSLAGTLDFGQGALNWTATRIKEK